MHAHKELPPLEQIVLPSGDPRKMTFGSPERNQWFEEARAFLTSFNPAEADPHELVNLLAPAESDISRNPEAVGRSNTPGESRGTGEASFEGWYWFLLGGAAFLFLEWLIWNRFS